MKAILLNGYGHANVLTIQDVPMPQPGPEQLLIKVRAIGLNRADILQRKGKYPAPPGESEILGLELAGDVVEWGSAVTGFTKGQRVFGLVAGGAYAEYCLMDKGMAIPMPKQWSYVEAAAIPEAFIASNESLFTLGQLRKGETVLIHAGGSGVGTAGIQMARSIGTTVFFTAGSAEKIAKGITLGATAGINYKTQNFFAEIMQLTNNQGVDVIEDFIGEKYFVNNLRLLKDNGRLIELAAMSGTQCELDLALIISHRLQIKGFVLRSQSIINKRAMTQRFCEQWLPRLIAGELKPIIDTIFSFEQVVAAHQHMEANKHFGKIILKLDSAL